MIQKLIALAVSVLSFQYAMAQEIQTFDAAISDLNIMNKYGNVIINARPSMGTSVPIKVTFRKFSDNQKCKPVVKSSGKVLELGNDPTPEVLASCRMDIEVEMPSAQGVNIMVDVDNGRAELRNVNSYMKLDLKVGRGDAILENATFDDINIAMEVSGNLAFSSEGFQNGDITSKDGNVSLKYIKLSNEGVMKVLASNGNIDVQIPVDANIVAQTEIKTATTTGIARGNTERQQQPQLGGQHSFECQSPRGNVQIRRR